MKLVLLLSLILSGCASSMAKSCQAWKYEDTKFELGLGKVYKYDRSSCYQFLPE